MVIDKFIYIKGKQVLIEDISHGSNKKIRVRCDICNKTREVFANQFFARKTDLCIRCKRKSEKKLVPPGSIFGRWTVIEDNGIDFSTVLCKCQCGTIREVDRGSLKHGSSGSCGCITKENNKSKRITLIPGTVFGRLMVVSSEITGNTLCKCDCGVVKEFATHSLLYGTKSCGCYQKEIVSARLSEFNSTRTKEKHPNWKGGISEERGLFDAQKETKEWKKKVYTRDNFTCVCCGQIGYKLNVHHIQSYSEHKEIRLALYNGITLCENCHRKFHKLFGRKNIDGEKLNRFVFEEHKQERMANQAIQ